MTATDWSRDLALLAAQAASDKLATDIAVIDVSDRLALTDCFVLATGSNERQVGAIVDEVTERLRRAGVKPLRREGERDGRWVLLDFLDVVVHVQHAEERVFYALDRLWKDCPSIPFSDRPAAVADGAGRGAAGAGRDRADPSVARAGRGSADPSADDGGDRSVDDAGDDGHAAFGAGR